MKIPLCQIALGLALCAPVAAGEWRVERAPNIHPNLVPPGHVAVYHGELPQPQTRKLAPARRVIPRVPPSQDDSNLFDFLFADDPAQLARLKAIRRSGALD
jgi:hypothetical protein